MTLQDSISTRLDTSALMASLTAELTGPTGVTSDLANVDLALSPDDVATASGAAGSIDLTGIQETVGTVLTDLTGVVDDLPLGDDLIEPLRDGLATLRTVVTSNLVSDLTAAIDRVGSEFREMEGDGALAAMRRLADSLQGAPELSTLKAALDGLLRVGGGSGLPDAKLAELIPAILSALDAIGAMMTLETMLTEAERLGALVPTQLPDGQIQGLAAALETLVATAEAELAAVDVNDVPAVDQAFENLLVIRAAARTMIETLREGMAFGEATLALADPDALVLRAEATLERLRGVAVTEISAVMTEIADKIAPLVTLDLAGVPQFSLEDLLVMVEGRANTMADDLASVDLTPFTGPMTEGLGAVTGVADDISAALEGILTTVQDALDQVRDAIAALPLDQVVGALRAVTDVIASVLSQLGDILGAAQAAIDAAAGTAVVALDRAETAVGAFTRDLEAAFQDAKTFVDGLNLPGVVGQAADGIQTVSDVIGQADMAPYFATAQDAINTTANVIDKVPFDLLPDEMEQDVVDLVRPIKAADLDTFEAEILDVLQIAEDGTFELRPELVAAVSEIQAKIDGLITALGTLHPQNLADLLNEALDEVRTVVEDFAPQVELGEITEALDTAKATIAGLDLGAVLQPLTDGFDQVLAAVDQVQPSTLLAPIEAEIDTVRQDFLDLTQLEEWRAGLDALQAEALSIVDLVDPEQLEEPLRAAFEDVRARLSDGNLPDLLGPLGGIISSLLAGAGEAVVPEAITRVSTWIRGASPGGEVLSQLSSNLSTATGAAHGVISQIDPDALADQMTDQLARLSAVVAALPAGAGRVRLETALGEMDLSTDLRLLTPHRDRYLEFLTRTEAAAANLAAKGFGEVDTVSVVLRAGFAPLMPLFATPREALEKMGFSGLQDGLPGLLDQVFAIATPERMAGLLTPIFAALHGRVETLLDAFIQPIRDFIDTLIGIVNLFDLGQFSDSLDDIHAAVRAQIEQFHPTTLLGEVETAFADAQAAVAAFDPLGTAVDALETLKATVLRVLEMLDGDALLATPIEIFETIVGALEMLDLNDLLDPLYDRLDAIAAQVKDGLDGTVSSFQGLQEALPSQVGGTSVGGSGSVSVGG